MRNRHSGNRPLRQLGWDCSSHSDCYFCDRTLSWCRMSHRMFSLLYSNNQQAKSPTVPYCLPLIQCSTEFKIYMTPTPLLSIFLQCYCEVSFKPVFKLMVSILDFLVWFSFVTKFNIFSSQKLRCWISQTTFSLICTYNMYLHNESVYDSFINWFKY